ncbi:hypothetical protein A8709_04910 [Paenibacillus pectinilyticus]|uniref:Periplasmic copper-binding protein NosD beta helix domain-containing protein n=1 Tax=Paenibacillus pectinilyticus TaxID=512399 RepID=A0A1C0ZSI9_9BACL|nr:right-handed parallel beta-helix repeat-containing protein [Paenibacillus pectinilyticus]OCT11045.1 hypothetical protein A8709_04910 [Paenibacillus pectinilyticus]
MARIYSITATDLVTYGIVTGFPVKPYVKSNYVNANNNIIGINKVLQYAYDNGYNHVVFPRADYAVCYPNPIITKSNLTIDFNFSNLKVIYDSDVRSPFDLTTNPIIQFSGSVILCTTPYTHIQNLNLIGDRIDRSFSSSAEKAIETTYGIRFGTGANYCSVRNCNLSQFMGDAISLGYTPYSGFDIGTMEFGSIDFKSGTTINGLTTNSLRSANFIALPSKIKSFTMIGLGYAPTTSIPGSVYSLNFYKSDNSFISSNTDVRTRDKVSVPKNAAKIKITFEGNGTLDDGCLPGNPPYWIYLIEQGLSDDVIIEHNEIHRNHRGGILLGTNNVTIQHNYFHDNAVPQDYDIDGIPSFTDFTRYCINTEDNVGHNCKIRNNVFDTTRMAIALRGEFNEITGNEFRHCVYGVILYNLNNCVITNNYFYFANLYGYEFDNFHRSWIIENNIVINSSLNFPGSGGSVASISNNVFTNNTVVDSPVQILNFRNNTFKNNSKFNVNNDLTKIEQCVFIDNSSIYVNAMPTSLDIISRCKFINSRIRVQNSSVVTVRDSDFQEGQYEYSTGLNTHTLINCTINNPTKPLVFSSSMYDIGSVRHNLIIDNCIISLGSIPLIQSFFWGNVSIKGSKITYSRSKASNQGLLDGYGSVLGDVEFINSIISSSPEKTSADMVSARTIKKMNCTFTNFELINVTAEIQSDKMSTMPTAGYYYLSQQVIKVPLVTGGNMGWICTQEGIANAKSWVASTNYETGWRINAKGHVYEVISGGGKSGVSQPAWTAVSGATYTDGALTWKEIGLLAVLRPFGNIY